jgi:hypothetical protein
MVNLVYKDRFIVNFARFDEGTTFWIPMADVSWKTDGLRESHTITGPLFSSKSGRMRNGL